MPRVVVTSLLAGAAAIVAVLSALYALQTFKYGASPAWSWDSGTVMTVAGRGAVTSRGWELTLDDSGRGLLVLPVPSLDVRRYPFLHLRFPADPAIEAMVVFWRTAQGGEQLAEYRVPGRVDESLWLIPSGMKAWSGELIELAIMVDGAPAGKLLFEKVELLPASPVNRLLAFAADWNARYPWGHNSINAHTGTRSVGTRLYPVPMLAALLTASLLACGILLWRAGRRFDWPVVSAMFLCCWIVLDLVWQGKLWHQLGLTYQQFSGRDSQARLLAGPDGALVEFMAEVQQLTAKEPGARIFVASSDDYTGMRGSYYLYPRNVFWRREKAEIPGGEYIRRGDYIVAINPTRTSFDPGKSTLLTPDGEQLAVAVLARGELGSVYRVM